MTKRKLIQLVSLFQLLSEKITIYECRLKKVQNSLLSTVFESQALVITILNDFKETVSPQTSLLDLWQKTVPFAQVKNFLLGFNTSVIAEMETQETSGSAASTVKSDSETPQNIETRGTDFSESPKKNGNVFNDLAFLP